MKQLRFLISAVIVAIILFAAIKSVWAQQVVGPGDSPKEQALLARVQGEINQNLQCSEAFIKQNRELATANARVKELEDKYEPKRPANAPPK